MPRGTYLRFPTHTSSPVHPSLARNMITVSLLFAARNLLEIHCFKLPRGRMIGTPQRSRGLRARSVGPHPRRLGRAERVRRGQGAHDTPHPPGSPDGLLAALMASGQPRCPPGQPCPDGLWAAPIASGQPRWPPGSQDGPPGSPDGL